MKKLNITPIFAVLDIVLLVVILISLRPSKDKVIEESLSESKYESIDETEDFNSGITDTEYETPVETNMEETVITEEFDPVEETGQAETTEDYWLNPGTETEGSTEKSIRDLSSFDTHDLPHIKDFKWVTVEVLSGELPSEAEKISFEDSFGGWKCYIIDDATEMERLANVEISGTLEDLELGIDWYYIRRGGKGGENYEDTTEDSVFRGYVNGNGDIEAEGQGKIRMTDIFTIGDHMYASGKLHWPDGIVGYLFLVRP
ncbi:MAG: hypothetical protein J6I76_16755 [Oribacterium sp.]|nr:hypothetical protein [Oribacterium sp.]